MTIEELTGIVNGVKVDWDPNTDCSEVAEAALASFGEGQLVTLILYDKKEQRCIPFKWIDHTGSKVNYYYHVVVELVIDSRRYIVDLTSLKKLYTRSIYKTELESLNSITDNDNRVFMYKYGSVPQDLVYTRDTKNLSKFKEFRLK